MKYFIESLHNEKAFEQFKKEISMHDKHKKFKGIVDVDDFLKRFDEVNTSREIKRLDNKTDKELYDENGQQCEVSACAEVELECSLFIRLYGIESNEEYNEDDEIYMMSSFGDYYAVEIY